VKPSFCFLNCFFIEYLCYKGYVSAELHQLAFISHPAVQKELEEKKGRYDFNQELLGTDEELYLVETQFFHAPPMFVEI
jgi:hypothetical protein